MCMRIYVCGKHSNGHIITLVLNEVPTSYSLHSLQVVRERAGGGNRRKLRLICNMTVALQAKRLYIAKALHKAYIISSTGLCLLGVKLSHLYLHL